MRKILDDAGLDLLFREARTHNGWSDKPVEQATIEALWDVLKWAPTSFNCLPARFVFVQSAEAKARLIPHLIPSNAAKTQQAPVCVIVAYDTKFQEFLPQTFPAYDAKPMFDANPALTEATAKRNSALQGAYLILAARALGLDCGPMSGFNVEGLDAEYFPDGRWKSNFLVNIGYGNGENMYPRSPRLSFAEACLVM
jgi:3-hydroxypropanoate dehydrogenase